MILTLTVLDRLFFLNNNWFTRSRTLVRSHEYSCISQLRDLVDRSPLSPRSSSPRSSSVKWWIFLTPCIISSFSVRCLERVYSLQLRQGCPSQHHRRWLTHIQINPEHFPSPLKMELSIYATRIELYTVPKRKLQMHYDFVQEGSWSIDSPLNSWDW